MTTYILKDDRIASACAEHILNAPHDGRWEVVIREYVKNRTDGQNRRYWADLTSQLNAMNAEIEAISQHTGYTNLEARRAVATTLPSEYSAILFCRSPEAAHDVLKLIAGIPTSTRLGTKAFSDFGDRMVQIVADIVGSVRAVAREAA